MNSILVFIALFPFSLGGMYVLYCLGKYLNVDVEKMHELEEKVKEYEKCSK